MATVSLNITPVNDAPGAQPQSLSTAEDTVAPITLTGGDVEGSALTYNGVTPPQHGSLEGTPASQKEVQTARIQPKGMRREASIAVTIGWNGGDSSIQKLKHVQRRAPGEKRIHPLQEARM